MSYNEDNPMPISDAQLEAMAIEQRNAILADTTDIVSADDRDPAEVGLIGEDGLFA